jgi:hypothetical protein
MFWSDLYDFFASPLWQSIGVIFGTIGIFFGAKYGAKLGYEATLKSQKVDLIESKEAYLLLVEDELQFNLNCLDSIRRYIIDSPPTESIFDAAEAGSNSIRLNAWEALVSAKVFPLLNVNSQISIQAANQEIRNAVKTIQLENAEWRRIREFRKYYDERPEILIQKANLDELSKQIRRNLIGVVEKTIHIVKTTISNLKHEGDTHA